MFEPNRGGVGLADRLASRYREAYLLARFLVRAGQGLQVMGLIVGVLVLSGALFLLEESKQFGLGSIEGPQMFGSLILGFLTGAPFFVLGLITGAQGQILLAALDTAVNSNRQLTSEEAERILFGSAGAGENQSQAEP